MLVILKLLLVNLKEMLLCTACIVKKELSSKFCFRSTKSYSPLRYFWLLKYQALYLQFFDDFYQYFLKVFQLWLDVAEKRNHIHKKIHSWECNLGAFVITKWCICHNKVVYFWFDSCNSSWNTVQNICIYTYNTLILFIISIVYFCYGN